MFPCSSCAAPISSDEVVEGVAQCAACGAVVDAPAAPPPMPSAPIALGEPPRGVFVRAYANGLHLILPWRAQLGPVVWLFLGVATVAPLLAAAEPWRAEGSPWLALLFSAFVGYNALCHAFNCTHVFIARGGVEVEHGPLPTWHRAVRLPASQVRRVAVVAEVKHRSSRGLLERGHYTVHHLVAPVPDVLLLSTWADDGPLRFVASAIEALHPPVERMADDDLRALAAMQRPSAP